MIIFFFLNEVSKILYKGLCIIFVMTESHENKFSFQKEVLPVTQKAIYTKN